MAARKAHAWSLSLLIFFHITLLSSLQIISTDASFRRTFKKLEEADTTAEYAVHEMDKKTVLRLVDKYVKEGFCKSKEVEGVHFSIRLVALATVDLDGPEVEAFLEGLKSEPAKPG